MLDSGSVIWVLFLPTLQKGATEAHGDRDLANYTEPVNEIGSTGPPGLKAKNSALTRSLDVLLRRENVHLQVDGATVPKRTTQIPKRWG